MTCVREEENTKAQERVAFQGRESECQDGAVQSSEGEEDQRKKRRKKEETTRDKREKSRRKGWLGWRWLRLRSVGTFLFLEKQGSER